MIKVTSHGKLTMVKNLKADVLRGTFFGGQIFTMISIQFTIFFLIHSYMLPPTVVFLFSHLV